MVSKKQTWSGLTITLLIFGLLALAACSPAVSKTAAPTDTQAPMAEEPGKVSSPLTEERLKNATYQIDELGEAKLVDGGYENKYGEGDDMVDRAGLLGLALGKLNGDDLNDAAVILWYNSGGSGAFIYLIALYNEGGVPIQAASKLLGDRVQVESLTIESGQIVLQAITHGPEDPLCCPSQRVIWVYACENDRLTQVHEIFTSTPEPAATPAPAETPAPEPTEVVEKAVDPLDGTEWHLTSYRNQDGELVGVPEGATVSASFEQGQIHGKAGCNSYFGSYEIRDGSIVFGALGQTEMYCMDPEGVMELEMAFLQALSQAAGYTIEGETLTFSDDGGSAAAVFGPAEEQNDLIGAWQWEESVTPVGSIAVDDPTRYVLEFLPGGQFSIIADCNSGSGTYSLVDNAITLAVGPMTLAACPEGSLGDRFVRDVNSAALYFMEDGYLYIDLMMDSGTMRFEK